MNQKLETQVSIVVPTMLVAVLDQLVFEYGVEHGERPDDCRRAVEIAIIQRGLKSLQDEIAPAANRRLGERMGWPKEEESGT